MTGVLVDTSVRVGHFRQTNDALVRLLQNDQVLMHPLVIGEMACGTPPQRAQTLADLGVLQPAQQASLTEVLDFIERERLYGAGCGLVDLMLLASSQMTSGALLWTVDTRLQAMARRIGVAYEWGMQ